MQDQSLNLIKNTLQNFSSNVLAIILFGSRARNEGSSNSDYDINIFVKEKDTKLEKIVDEIRLKDEKLAVNIYDVENFNYLKKLAHPLLYCCFRDGILISGNRSWFEKEKQKILKLKPTKKIIKEYLRLAKKNLEFSLYWCEKFREIPLTECKVVVNQVGFALIMNEGKYPKGPHSLYEELMKISKEKKDVKIKEFAKILKYFQKKYYQGERFYFKPAYNKLVKLKGFLKSLLLE